MVSLCCSLLCALILADIKHTNNELIVIIWRAVVYGVGTRWLVCVCSCIISLIFFITSLTFIHILGMVCSRGKWFWVYLVDFRLFWDLISLVLDIFRSILDSFFLLIFWIVFLHPNCFKLYYQSSNIFHLSKLYKSSLCLNFIWLFTTSFCLK